MGLSTNQQKNLVFCRVSKIGNGYVFHNYLGKFDHDLTVLPNPGIMV